MNQTVTRRRARGLAAAALGGVALAAGLAGGAATANAAPVNDVAGRVLVLSDGQPMVNAIRDRLASEGVPMTVVDLNAAGRPAITSASLSRTDASGTHALYQGIVLPTAAPAALSSDELATLAVYERETGAREVSAYNWANPTLGLNYPEYSGPVDGVQAQVTPAGTAGPFAYLSGTVALDDIDPAVAESYGYLATPVAATATTSFTPLVTATIPGTSQQGTLVGEYHSDGRDRLVITFASNTYQSHWRVLSHGIVTWLTRGVSLSYNRNYLSVHSDDFFMDDARWSAAGNCTIGDGCDPVQYPETAPGAAVRMTPADVAYMVDWQRRFGLKVDAVFNGAGADQAPAGDPLTASLVANRAALRWVNHTYAHPYLGCVQDFTTTPWHCATGAAGTLWASQADIASQIASNKTFAASKGISINPQELVTGEHSGLATLPQMTTDNPNLAPALNAQGVKWIASDASREREQRRAGLAYTVPRYPMNIYYNVGTRAELVDEYNWIYTSRANGGSGLCEDNPATSTCIAPLDPGTGYDGYIRPYEARVAFGHVVSNDPRPHYAHQSNQAEDRVLYPVLEDVVNRYRATFAASAPFVNPSLAQAGTALYNQRAWTASQADVTSAIHGDSLVVTNTSASNVTVPVTLPATAAQGAAYGGQRSAYLTVGPRATVSIPLGGVSGYTAQNAPVPPTTQPPAPTVSAPPAPAAPGQPTSPQGETAPAVTAPVAPTTPMPEAFTTPAPVMGTAAATPAPTRRVARTVRCVRRVVRVHGKVRVRRVCRVVRHRVVRHRAAAPAARPGR